MDKHEPVLCSHTYSLSSCNQCKLEAEIAELKEKLISKQHVIDASTKMILAQNISKADAIREMLSTLLKKQGYIHAKVTFNMMQEYADTLEKGE